MKLFSSTTATERQYPSDHQTNLRDSKPTKHQSVKMGH